MNTITQALHESGRAGAPRPGMACASRGGFVKRFLDTHPMWACGVALPLAACLLWPRMAPAQSSNPTLLADQPVFNATIPGNLAFVLSNEYPTNENDANWSNYLDNVNYAGYFDPNKCYVYQLNIKQPGQSYFRPVTHAGGPNKHFCDIDSLAAAGSDVSSFSRNAVAAWKMAAPRSLQYKTSGNAYLSPNPLNVSGWTADLTYFDLPGRADAPWKPDFKNAGTGLWSGNFMNWASMQSIDPIRATLTGGYRVVDRASTDDDKDTMPDGGKDAGSPLTILEKAWNDYWYVGKPSSQMRGTDLIKSWYSDYAVQYTVDKSLVGNLTPFGNWVNSQWNPSPTNNNDDPKTKIQRPGGFYTFIKGMGNRMQISPADSTLWYPINLPTLWVPSSEQNKEGNTKKNQASYLDIKAIAAQKTIDSNATLDTIGARSGYYLSKLNVGVDNTPLWKKDENGDYKSKITNVTPNITGLNNFGWGATQPPSVWYNTWHKFGDPNNNGTLYPMILSDDGVASANVPVDPSLKPASSDNDKYGNGAMCSNDINVYPCYQVYVRVSVCENTNGLDGKSLLESNCVYYPKPSPHYKPEGLFQRYASQLRYSVFSYPYNHGSNTVLLRAPMGFIGPTQPGLNGATPAPNDLSEWDASTGVMKIDPNPNVGIGNEVGKKSSTFTNRDSKQDWSSKLKSTNLYYTVGLDGNQSGFLNYINRYGEYYGYIQDSSYKVWDIIDDLYYAALRYYRNQGNPWKPGEGSMNLPGNSWGTKPPDITNPLDLSHPAADGFPYQITWTDPILYRCQKNFILGLSDSHTWNGNSTGDIEDIPNLDGNSNAVTDWVDRVGAMEGIANSQKGSWPVGGGNAPTDAWPGWDGNGIGTTGSYYTAGMAYYLHTSDIRPDLPAQGKPDGRVSVDTYWVDVTEFNAIEHLSPYVLAAKYGGFSVPAGYDASQTTPLPQSWWNTTGEVMSTHLRGDHLSFNGSMPKHGLVPNPDGSGGAQVPCGDNGVSCWQTVNRGKYPRPDNFFTAATSANMAASLQKALAGMVNGVKAYSTAFALTSAAVEANGSGSYSAQYSRGNWTGTIFGSSLSVIVGNANTDSSASLSQLWNTDGALATQFITQPATDTVNADETAIVHTDAYYGWDVNRRVVTWNGSAGAPFRWDSLTGAQQSALYPDKGPTYTYDATWANTAAKSDVTATLPNGGADYVNYLRGDRTNEADANIAGGVNKLRARGLLLGDILNSKLTAVGQPEMPYAERANPGYAAFKAVSRTPMVYAGANDGMMHAINGSLTLGGAGGTEVFAYVPSAMFGALPDSTATLPIPTQPGAKTTTAPNTALAWLGNPNYVHHNMVDATPMAFDLDFDRAGQADPITGKPDWRTILIGGLGKGGKSYYAIDVTRPDDIIEQVKTLNAQPAAPTQADNIKVEKAVAKNVLWEFTASGMGYSYGEPIVVKTAQYGWVVALTAGYNTPDGKGHLYLLNPRDGTLLKDITTSGQSSGMTRASAYVSNYADYTADSVYAGDLDGNLWRFSLKDWSVTLLARLTDPSGAPQPITTAPQIEIYNSATASRRFVLVGTGRLLDATDIASTQTQSFYAITDGDVDNFNTASKPVTRENLTQLKDLTVPSDLTGSLGWYLDLNSPNYNYVAPGSSSATASESATGERVVIPATAYNGVVAFSTQLMTPDLCLPTLSNLYVIDFGTGQSKLPNNVTSLPQTSVITDLRVTSENSSSSSSSSGSGGIGGDGGSGGISGCSGNDVGLLIGDNSGKIGNFAPLLGSGQSGGGQCGVKVLNWRNVQEDGQ